MLFASKGIIAKFAYARGIHFEALVVARALLAVPLFWAFALQREPARVIRTTSWQTTGLAAFAGIVCYYGGALLDFEALTMIDASVERVLIFSYPAMVVAIGSVMRRSWPSASVLTAVALTWVGIYFAVGGGDAHTLRANLYGSALVLAAALSYAIYFMIGERCTREIGASRFTLIAMSAAAAVLLVHALLRGTAAHIAAVDPPGWLLLAMLAVLCMFVPALLQAEGVRRLSAQRGALVSTVGPPTTIVLAWLLFDERMSALQLGGVALIVSGILVLDLAVFTRRR